MNDSLRSSASRSRFRVASGWPVGRAIQRRSSGNGTARRDSTLGRRWTDEGDINEVLRELRQQGRGRLNHEPEFDVGVRFAKGADRGWDERVERRRAREADAKSPEIAVTDPARREAGPIDFPEGRFSVRQEGFACRGERHAARRPREQRRADFGFQLPDLLTQRRLGDAELLRRAREMALGDDGHEIPQVS